MPSKLFFNYQRIREKVFAACRKSGRKEKNVLIIAVSKNRSGKEIRSVYEVGLRNFGENRVQEADEKYEAFPSNCILHMVGHLQSNKAGRAVELFDVIHSVDSVHLAEKISHRAQEIGKLQQILVQVNITGEESKGGVSPAELENVLQQILALPNVRVIGLMTMAPLGADEAMCRKCFGHLRSLRDQMEQKFGVKLPHLSMGMTGDFEIAVEEGATMIRIGRGLFD